MFRCMLGLLIATTVAQAALPPTVALLERPAPGTISRERLDQVLEGTRLELERAKVPVSLLAPAVQARLVGTAVEGCTRGLDCLFRIGEVIRADVVVSVEATQLEDDVAVSLDAVAPPSERRLARRSFVVKATQMPGALTAELAAFAQEVSKALAPADAPIAIAAPPLVVVEPAAPVQPLAVGRKPAYAASAGAVVTGGAAVALFASALTHDSKARQVEDGTTNARLTHAQAQERVRLANRNAGLSLASAGLSAALTATAIYLWTR